jgi:uncharacterized membrane protein
MSLALVVWLGGIIFFIVLAPTAFSVLPSHPIAALLIGPMLSKLHWMGISAGAIFLLCSAVSRRTVSARTFFLQNLLIALMLMLTAISQFFVMPRMAALRKPVGDIELLPFTDPVRMQFNALHIWSTRLEGAVLLCGLVVLYCVSRERQVA